MDPSAKKAKYLSRSENEKFFNYKIIPEKETVIYILFIWKVMKYQNFMKWNRLEKNLVSNYSNLNFI